MKYTASGYHHKATEINRNMRCIEIVGEDMVVVGVAQINRNMRCIEIAIYSNKKEK